MPDEQETPVQQRHQATAQDHQVYTGRRHRGNQLYEYGKCLCGAVLQGKEEIDAHRSEHPKEGRNDG